MSLSKYMRIVVLLIFFLVLFNQCQPSEQYCFNEQSEIRLLRLVYRGVYLDKYRNSNNKGLWEMVIRYKSDTILYSQSFTMDQDLYKMIKKGDSIIKEKGSLDVKVVRGDSSVTFKNYCQKFRYKLINDTFFYVESGDTVPQRIVGR